MHICFITATMAGGGTERVIAVLANYFVKQNNKITILLTASDKIEYDLDPQIEIIQLGGETGGRLAGRLQRIIRMRNYFRKNRDTVYLSFGTETNMFAILSAFFMKRKLVVSERNDPNKCTFKKKRDLLYPFAKGFVFQTQDAMDCFPESIRKKGLVIPNPVSGNVPERFTGERRKEIIAVGRLEEQKNHKLLIEAYADFAKVIPDFTLKIYGKGYLKQELENYAKELNIAESVIFADFAKDVLEQIKDSYMYVLSSDYEGISNSLLEAVAMGLPVISTDCPIGGSKMLIKDHQNGILVPVGNRKALADAMIELAEDKEFANRISIEAAGLKKDYSVEQIAKMWQDVIDKMQEQSVLDLN